MVSFALAFYLTGYGLLMGKALWVISAGAFAAMILDDTFSIPARELLLIPLPARIRVRAQSMAGGILSPMGQGVGGVLLVTGSLVGLALHQYSLIVLGLAGIWLVLLALLRPRYKQVLATTLSSTYLDAVELDELVQRPEADGEVVRLLESADTGVVKFTLGLLHNRPLGKLAPQVRELARAEDDGVAAAAVELLGTEHDGVELQTIERSIEDSDAARRKAGILAYCRSLKVDAVPRVMEWLDDGDPVSREAALVGSCRYGGRPGLIVSLPTLAQGTSSPSAQERCDSARLLGEIGDPENGPWLARLLDDQDQEVLQAALTASERMSSKYLVPALLRLFEHPSMRPSVVKALVRLPAECAADLAAAARDGELNDDQRGALLHVIARIGGPQAVEVLWPFINEGTVVLRVAAGRALRDMALRFDVTTRMEDNYEECLQSSRERLALLGEAWDEAAVAGKFVTQLLGDQVRLEIDALLNLLGLRYGMRRIEQVRNNLYSASQSQRANALELLDEMLPRTIAASIVQLIEPHISDEEPDGQGLTLETARRLASEEPWLQVTAVYAWTNSGREASEIVQLGPAEQSLYELMETVAFLKHVPLFR